MHLISSDAHSAGAADHTWVGHRRLEVEKDHNDHRLRVGEKKTELTKRRFAMDSKTLFLHKKCSVLETK